MIVGWEDSNPRRTNQTRFNLPYMLKHVLRRASLKREVTQFVFVQISLRLTNDSFIDYTFCRSTGLWSQHLSEHPHLLLRIACTIPVTSADNERSNSTLKLVKGYLRTTMTTERLSGPALMSIHYEKPFNYDAIVQKFAEQQPRRMLLVDPIFEES